MNHSLKTSLTAIILSSSLLGSVSYAQQQMPTEELIPPMPPEVQQMQPGAQQTPTQAQQVPATQQTPSVPEVQVPPMPQPRSNLDRQVPGQAPAVVYPKPSEVVQGVVDDLSDLQLTPEQWDTLKEIHLQRERQRSQPYSTPPRPITRSLILNLDAGISPPVMRLARGQLSSIVFSDPSGHPWQIEQVMLNRQLFSDGRQGNPEPGKYTNVLTIEPLTPAAYGNVTVILRGLSTPVIFILLSGQKDVDLRVDAKIPGTNPDTPTYSTASFNRAPELDSDLVYFLDNVPPKEASRLRVTGLANTDAWLYRDQLYVRTRADVQYPAFISSARSTTGQSVYKFSQMYNNVTLTTGGQAVTIHLEK